MSTRELVTRIIHEQAEALDLEIVELRVEPSRRVHCVIDREPDGVTIDDCTALSRAVRRTLVDHEIDPGDYNLEMMSPGLNRLLVRDKDFARFTGCEVTVGLTKKVDDRRNFQGLLLGRDEQAVRVRLDQPDGERAFPRNLVHEVRLVPDLGSN